MERASRLLSLGALVAALATLVACDNTPNPNFEQALQDRRAARAGDPYVQLENNLPRQDAYLRVEAALRADSAAQLALGFRSNYESMLKKFDADPKIQSAGDIVKPCRASFAEAAAYQKDNRLGAGTATPAAAPIVDRLNACRAAASSAQAGANEAVGEAAAVLKRFASTGLVVVGVATVAHGDEAAGLDIWRRGSDLVREDKPGFSIKPEMFKR